mmetsp:Transcript_3476/g.9217  ORF Transcript_3476/g.9217 Transcript_3476/m.9217 type:complete len:225 (+) Transcript_3476:112-786(+)
MLVTRDDTVIAQLGFGQLEADPIAGALGVEVVGGLQKAFLHVGGMRESSILHEGGWEVGLARGNRGVPQGLLAHVVQHVALLAILRLLRDRAVLLANFTFAMASFRREGWDANRDVLRSRFREEGTETNALLDVDGLAGPGFDDLAVAVMDLDGALDHQQVLLVLHRQPRLARWLGGLDDGDGDSIGGAPGLSDVLVDGESADFHHSHNVSDQLWHRDSLLELD